MLIMSVTDFARNMKEVLNRVEYRGEEVLLVRNNKKLVKLVPQNSGGTALEVMADIYRTIPNLSAQDWLDDSRKQNLNQEIRDPWDI